MRAPLKFSLSTGTNPDDAVAGRMYPFRADLMRRGIPPRRWPDFDSTLRRREETLNDKKTVMIKAEITVNSKDGSRNVPIGMAVLRLPEFGQSPVASRSSNMFAVGVHKVYLKPILGKLSKQLTGFKVDGTDLSFLKTFLAEVHRGRVEVGSDLLHGKPHALLEVLFVHPAYRRLGAGTALLQHCFALAKVPAENGPSIGLPIISEASSTTMPLYLRLGFRDIMHRRMGYGRETFEWSVMLRELESKNMLIDIMLMAAASLSTRIAETPQSLFLCP
ncbi:uncharacterized protein FOMMEDRAFT_151320 [Fomitiporia mediterranea MF3/22]|uniref:uncharacterized protein n=1 Tax=Fomitiporia mediterranea (strain MF3/22) TaxID=694068 RepID=UPI000440836C|nr:uncharacterized protein FOMMEDRAFT_151320 [Fomitiporia mediterranea MF3/22]EJD08457.1 hypothetical protein FOMMEDRAFT_151320 [Fomitiporia mediterranea MF3/22]